MKHPRRQLGMGVVAFGILVSLGTSGACFSDWDRLDPSMATGEGGASVCSPGETIPCYSGPEGTEGVGICVGGVSTCNDDGTAFGSCEDEVLPVDEDCDTTDDDDCDGQTNELDAGCDCTPGDLIPCYEGPEATVGVGICTGGRALCEADSSLTACIGQVVPTTEECVTPEDDDCDGDVNEGCPLWAVRFGDGFIDDSPWSVAVDANDAIVMAGESDGDLDFGGGVLTAAGGLDAWVVKLGASGSHLWSQRWGDAQDSSAHSVAVDAAGNVYVAGSFEGTLDLGATSLISAGLSDAFVVKLDPTGVAQWAVRLGDADEDHALDVAVDSAGANVVVTGYFAGSIDVGMGDVPSNAAEDGFVVSLLGATGTIGWGKTFGSTGDDRGVSVAIDASDNVYIGGTYDERVNLGGPEVTEVNGLEAFVGKMDGSGTQQWLHRIAGNGDQVLYDLALDPSANVVVQGEFSDDVDFGEGAVSAAAADDVFVGKYDTSGALVWGHSFGGPGNQHIGGISADANGNVWFGVSHELTTDYGGGPVLSAGDDDFVWVKLDAMGDHVRSLRFGDPDDQDARSIAVDSQDNVIVAGECQDDVDFGFGVLTGDGFEDICLAKLPP